MTNKRFVGMALAAVLTLSACGGGGGSGQAKQPTGDPSRTAAADDTTPSGDPLQAITCPPIAAAAGAVGSGVKLQTEDHRPVAYNCNYVRDDSGTADGDINYAAMTKDAFDQQISDLRQTADTDLTTLSGYGDEGYVVHVKDLVHEEYAAFAVFGSGNAPVAIHASVSSDHNNTATSAKATALLDLALTTTKLKK